MKKIKLGEYKDKKCAFCSNKAEWRANKYSTSMYACDIHKQEIVDVESKYMNDDHISEGDYQSWFNI